MINIVRLKYTDDFQGFRNVQFAQKTNKRVFELQVLRHLPVSN